LNDPYTIPGLVRIQQAELPGLIGPSAASHVQAGFTEFAEGIVQPLSYCPAWKTADGIWHSLAEGIPPGSVYDRDAGIDPASGGGSVVFESAAPTNKVRAANKTGDTVPAADAKAGDRAAGDTVENAFDMTWMGPLPGIRSVCSRYVQRADQLTVTYVFEGEIEAAGALIPLMYSDGQEQAVITQTGQGVRTEYRGAYVESTAHDAGAVIRLDQQETSSRNGLLKKARIEVHGALQLTFTIQLGRM
jgi:hypothetical protein